MAEERQPVATRRSPTKRRGTRWSEHIREALAQIEEQRDDAVLYLSAIKLILDVLARWRDPRQCGQEITEALVQQLTVEACALVLREGRDGELALTGFAAQDPGFGSAGGGVGEKGWLALARQSGDATEPTYFRRPPAGGFELVPMTELSGEGFCVLPLQVGGETAGALLLHSLVAPTQLFAGGRALALVAEIVGQALTVANTRASVQRLCHDLESELGLTRRTLSAREESLRSQERNIHDLTHNLIRSNRVKRELLGTVSHELRTPLNAILGYTALVRDGVAGPVADEQRMLLDRVLTNTRGLNQLIDDMLFFVQLEADRVIVKHERVAIPELIDQVVTSIPEPPARDRVTLSVQVAPEASALRADPELLRRLLFHLVGNALKFTARGEVSVEVRPGVELGAALIVVRDTGIGIPPDRLQAVFELFSQADSSTTRRYNGLGMGLTLVQRCVRLLRGELAVDSRSGMGTEFRIHLPGALLVPGDADDSLDAPRGTLH